MRIGTNGAALIVCAAFAIGVARCAAETRELIFVFFAKGERRAQSAKWKPEELEKMQANHIRNLERMGKEGVALTAGPLGDNGFLRGIVIMNIASRDAAPEQYKNDPYVQNGLLALQTHRWLTDTAAIQKYDEPFDMAQHTLVIVKRGANWKPLSGTLQADSMLRLMPSLRKLEREGELALSGPLLDAGERVGILLFRTSDPAKVQADLAQDPAVRAGRVAVEAHPQYLAAGVLRPVDSRTTAPPKPGKRIRLFDGRSFAGWEGDTGKLWRIEQGALVGGSLAEAVPHNDFLTTAKECKNFDLRLKVRLVGKEGFLNGGIQIRSQRLENPPHEMKGYQADMGEGYWASLYDESRRNQTLAKPNAARLKSLLRPNDWNDYVIRCEGKRIRLWLNGELTVDYTETEPDIPLSGRIGLQIHGGGKAEAWYKEITLEALPE
jgi:uncharacterized protein YciI